MEKQSMGLNKYYITMEAVTYKKVTRRRNQLVSPLIYDYPMKTFATQKNTKHLTATTKNKNL